MTVMRVLFFAPWVVIGAIWVVIGVVAAAIMVHLIRDLARHNRALKCRTAMHSVTAPTITPRQGPAPRPYNWADEEDGNGNGGNAA